MRPMHRNNATTENSGVAVIPFAFEGCRVRAIVDKNGEPWFVAKDIATILGYKNPQKAVRDHCKEARNIGSSSSLWMGVSPTLDPQTIIIPERDVYRLIMRSRLPAAERFEEWIVGEVLGHRSLFTPGNDQVSRRSR